MILAITGTTGFVGSHALDLALAEGHTVRALARRPQPDRAGVTWIAGALDDEAALASLVAGSDSVLHIAGIVNAADRAGFAHGNIIGTEAMIAAATNAGIRRFVQVSSLAAREPALSDYGWSKAQADAALQASTLDWTIVRPPAIFGPRDHEMLELFRLAKRGLVPLPPKGGRLSVLYVRDLARLLLNLTTGAEVLRAIVEPDDGMARGWDPRAFVRAIGDAVGTRARPLPLPRPLLEAAGAIDRTLRGRKAKLTRDRIRYFCHPDWTAHVLPPAPLWEAATATRTALIETAAWYRANGLL